MFTTFSAWVDLLFKAAGHKYIRRIPYASGGKTRYRYIYKVTHTAGGKHALHEDDVTVGAAFMLGTDKGSEVHAHVKSVDGDKVTVEYDDGPRKGEKETMSKRDLLSKLDAAHGISQALQGEREKQAKVVSELRASGASEKQIAREQARLDRLGVEAREPEAEKPAPNKRAPKASRAKMPISPARTKGTQSASFEKVQALITKYEITPEQIDVDALYPTEPPRLVNNGFNPEYALYTRLSAISYRDPSVWVEQHNTMIAKAAKELDDMGLWEYLDNMGPRVLASRVPPQVAEFLSQINATTPPPESTEYDVDSDLADKPHRADEHAACINTLEKTKHLFNMSGGRRLTRFVIRADASERAHCDGYTNMDGDIRVKVTLNKRRTTAERAVTTAIHEVAHLIEMMSPASSATTLLSTLPRIKADSVSAVSGGHKGEQKFESDFASSYTGKMYHSHGSAGCSEYLSMALQAMMQGNKSAIMFAKADPHAFITTYAIMKGYHL